jgi:endonuclease G
VPNCFIGPHLVAVPTHLFKAVLTMSPDSEFAAYGYLAPNCFPPKGAKAVKYLISIDRLEDITGYDFFPNLPDSIEASIESVGPRRSATVAKRNAPR